MFKMNLFVCAVLLCVIFGFYLIKVSGVNKPVTIKMLENKPNSLKNTFDTHEKTDTPYFYSSTREINGLTDIEFKINSCRQQNGLLDVELSTLQNQAVESKQKKYISCQNQLKTKLGVYKRLYKTINNSEISQKELSDIEKKIGIEPELDNHMFV